MMGWVKLGWRYLDSRIPRNLYQLDWDSDDATHRCIGSPMILLSLLAAVVGSGQSFACTPTHVWDGDGPIWCAEGPKIRLAGIAARDRLVRLLGGAKDRASTGHVLVSAPTMQCVSNGSARGDRTGAWCSLPSTGDLSCAMIRSGAVARWDRYSGKRCR